MIIWYLGSNAQFLIIGPSAALNTEVAFFFFFFFLQNAP